MSSDATQFRRDFWTRYAELYPDDGVVAGWGRVYSWIPVESADVNVSLAVYPWGTGLWLRGRKGESLSESGPRIQGFKDSFRVALSDAFDGRLGNAPGTEWVDVDGGFDAKRGVRRGRHGQLARYGGVAALHAANLLEGYREEAGSGWQYLENRRPSCWPRRERLEMTVIFTQ